MRPGCGNHMAVMSRQVVLEYKYMGDEETLQNWSVFSERRAEMEQKMQLCVLMLLVQVSGAVWQRVTVRKGQKVDLSCPVANAHQTSMDWMNPKGDIMYFRHKKSVVIKVLKEKRYSINTQSDSDFTVSISHVTFKDGGNYTCHQYDGEERRVELTVLDQPRIIKTKHEGQMTVKCTAEGTNYPPQISWKLDHGPEILIHSQILHEDERYVSSAMLYFQSLENRVTVKCLVRHPGLHSKPLMDFVKIGRNSLKPNRKTTTLPPTVQPQGSSEGIKTTTSWFRHGRTTVYYANVDGDSSDTSIKASSPTPSKHLFSSKEPNTDGEASGQPLTPGTSTGSNLSTSSKTNPSDSIFNATRTAGSTLESNTTEETTSSNHTDGNRTGDFNLPKMQMENGQSSSLLIFLVSCLIFSLLVVVIFIAIKLWRAHITWKIENEDCDPSEESNKSKSSQEERNTNGQRQRGPWSTAFSQYVVEQPPVIVSSVMAASGRINEEQMSQPQSLGQTLDKETEL